MDLFDPPARSGAYMPESKSTEWGTPWDRFRPWNDEFHFTLDACARDWNTKVPERWFSLEQNGLMQPWCGEVVWCNPPYGSKNIEQWLAKAASEREFNTLTVLLLPNTTENKWFHQYVFDPERQRVRQGIELRFIKGRINFDMPPGFDGKDDGNPKGSILVIVHPRKIIVPICPTCGR